MKVGEAMYKASQAEAETASADGTDDGDFSDGGSDDDTVVDADFEEVEDEDKKDSAS